MYKEGYENEYGYNYTNIYIDYGKTHIITGALSLKRIHALFYENNEFWYSPNNNDRIREFCKYLKKANKKSGLPIGG
jgi:hypothetical protein